jgi:type IV pilus assembly protein PilZ
VTGVLVKSKIIYNIAEEENYHDGQVIFKEGSPGDWIYVILSGAVEISKDVQGQKYVIAILKQGEVFGELGFVGVTKRTATARAIGQTSLGIIDREFLEKEYNQLSGQFRSIVEVITLRFKEMLDRSCAFSKRTAPRVERALSLVFKDREAFFRAYTGNVSAGGLFIKTENPLIVGDRLSLKLQLPGAADPLHIRCEVVWSRTKQESQPGRPAGMGVKFLKMSERDTRILKQYLSSIKADK